MHIDHAILCEFATVSANGLHSFMHVFDKTTFQNGTPMGVRGFLAVKLSDLPESSELEVYMTDDAQVIGEKGRLMKGNIKGPMSQIVFRFGIPIEKTGTYTFWARLEGGEPVRLTQWTAEQK